MEHPGLKEDPQRHVLVIVPGQYVPLAGDLPLPKGQGRQWKSASWRSKFVMEAGRLAALVCLRAPGVPARMYSTKCT